MRLGLLLGARGVCVCVSVRVCMRAVLLSSSVVRVPTPRVPARPPCLRPAHCCPPPSPARRPSADAAAQRALGRGAAARLVGLSDDALDPLWTSDFATRGTAAAFRGSARRGGGGQPHPIYGSSDPLSDDMHKALPSRLREQVGGSCHAHASTPTTQRRTLRRPPPCTSDPACPAAPPPARRMRCGAPPWTAARRWTRPGLPRRGCLAASWRRRCATGACCRSTGGSQRRRPSGNTWRPGGGWRQRSGHPAGRGAGGRRWPAWRRGGGGSALAAWSARRVRLGCPGCLPACRHGVAWTARGRGALPSASVCMGVAGEVAARARVLQFLGVWGAAGPEPKIACRMR